MYYEEPKVYIFTVLSKMEVDFMLTERDILLALTNRPTPIYHITHVLNLATIIRYGLLSHNNPHKQVDISNIQVNERRNKLEKIYKRNLHDYAPLYFNPRNAMLYKNQKEHGPLIIILGFRKELLLTNNVVFTDSNAASYKTNYYNDINCLSGLDWNSIWSDRWCDDEIKRKMMAEVLVYEKVDISNLETIYCQTHVVKQSIEKVFDLGHIKVETNQNMFFEE